MEFDRPPHDNQDENPQSGYEDILDGLEAGGYLDRMGLTKKDLINSDETEEDVALDQEQEGDL
jgi:hypothetical protein